jgi:hypothetical protein
LPKQQKNLQLTSQFYNLSADGYTAKSTIGQMAMFAKYLKWKS